MKKIMTAAVIFAGVMMLAGCSKGGESESAPEPVTLPVAVEEGTVSYYKGDDKPVNLTPVTKLKLHGVDFGLCTLNTEPFNFREKSVQEFIETACADIDGSKTKQIENDDFTFFGFAVTQGNPRMYVEFVDEKGELVTSYDESKLKSYKLKALYTSDELLGSGGGAYLTFGARLFTGLTKTDIEMTEGKGYTSGFDENTFYYPDAAGCTLALTYKMGKPADTSTETDAEKPTGETNEELILSELFFFME